MPTYRFFQIDAFTERALAGGPAAVMPMDAFPSDAELQAIASENNLAETAFIVAKGEGVFDLRWFTPRLEVPLCGHATLASAHALFAHLGFEGQEIGFDTLSGRLSVTRLEDGRLEMDFPAQPPRRIEPPAGLVEALGAPPVEVLEAPYLLAIYRTPREVRDLAPDIAAIAAIGPGMVICAAQAGEETQGKIDVVSRFFAPSAGIAEDPATGSAHCIIAPHFSTVLGKDQLHCFQAYPGRGADITTRMAGDRVKLIGHARTVIEGSFHF